MRKLLEKVKSGFLYCAWCVQKLLGNVGFLHGWGRIGFVYHLEHVGANGEIISRERLENIIPDVGRDYILTSSMLSGSQYAAWYIGLYKDAYTAVEGDTLTTFLANANECITYDTAGDNRLTLTPDALADGLFSNNGTPAEFDFNTQGETIRGGFITGTQSRLSSTGLLLSAILFPTPKVLALGETLRVKAGIQLVTA